jgi:hypothetical protein
LRALLGLSVKNSFLSNAKSGAMELLVPYSLPLLNSVKFLRGLLIIFRLFRRNMGKFVIIEGLSKIFEGFCILRFYNRVGLFQKSLLDE